MVVYSLLNRYLRKGISKEVQKTVKTFLFFPNYRGRDIKPWGEHWKVLMGELVKKVSAAVNQTGENARILNYIWFEVFFVLYSNIIMYVRGLYNK
jgi:hypothetical protein